MKTIFKRIYRQAGLIQQLGLSPYLRYRFASKGAKIRLHIGGYDVVVRKGTPDLGVAISCLNGEFDILKYLLPAGYSGTIVDAGGYIGTATLALKNIFPKSKVIVVEPSEDNLSLLKENLAQISDVQIVYGALVGTSEKTIQLNNRGTGEWGFTVVGAPKDNPNSMPLHSAPAYRLSDLVSDGENIGLLKLDIEGGELNLLENDMSSLQKIEVVFAELHDRIAPGCKQKYLEFSENRILIKDKGEKYLSIKR